MTSLPAATRPGIGRLEPGRGRGFVRWAIGLLLVVVVPVGFWLGDRAAVNRLERERVAREQSARAAGLLAWLRQSGDDELQLRRLLQEFRRRAFARLRRLPAGQAVLAVRELHRRWLAGRLPPHDLVLARFQRARERLAPVFCHDGGLGLVAVVDEFVRGLPWWYYSPARMPDLMAAMRRVLRFPFSADLVSLGSMSRLQWLNALEGSRGFFWETEPPIIEGWDMVDGMMAVVLDQDRLARDFGPRAIVTDWRRPTIGVGFVALQPGHSHQFSSFFARRPRLRRQLIELSKRNRTRSIELSGDRYLVAVDQAFAGDPWRRLVVLPQPRRPVRSHPIAGLGVALLAVVLVLLSPVGRAILSDRLPRRSVGMVLFGTLLLVVALPALGIRGVFRLLLHETVVRSRQESQRELHRRLDQFDREGRSLIQAHHQTILRQLLQPARVRSLVAASRSRAADAGLASLAVDLARSLPMSVHSHFPGVLQVVSPEGYQQIWSYMQKDRKDDRQGDLTPLFGPASRRALRRLIAEADENDSEQLARGRSRIGGDRLDGAIARTRLEPAPSRAAARNARVAESDGPHLTVDQDAVEFEMIRAMIEPMVGLGTMLRLLTRLGRLVEVRLPIGRVFFVLLPLRTAGRPRLMLTIAWDDASIAVSFREHRFADRSQDPPNLRVFVADAHEQRSNSMPPGITRYPELEAMLAAAKVDGQPRQAFAETPGGYVVREALPGQCLSKQVFVGELAVADPTRALRHAWGAASVAGFGLALLLAALATWFLMSPLRRALAAIRSVRPGRYEVRLVEDAERVDEFGVLARAFNAMVDGLREKELLDRFVSSAVRRVVADDRFREAARAGESRPVTVLFSALHGFEDYQAVATPAAVYEAMNQHLTAMDAALTATGGEIDKVIGDKIMAVFDHQTLGGAVAAARAAVAVARELRRTLADSPVPPVFGINAGPVIAGLLGSPDVRVDYTVIGDTVNLAARLATLAHITDGTRTVLAGEVVRVLGAEVIAERLPFRTVKGKTHAVEAFLLTA